MMTEELKNPEQELETPAVEDVIEEPVSEPVEEAAEGLNEPIVEEDSFAEKLPKIQLSKEQKAIGAAALAGAVAAAAVAVVAAVIKRKK